MPESYLYADGGRLCCADFPADRLEIAPGDLLSLVDETPLGYIVKKDGVSGLYGGRMPPRWAAVLPAKRKNTGGRHCSRCLYAKALNLDRAARL